MVGENLSGEVACGCLRLLHSPSLVAIRLPVGYETCPPIGWHYLFLAQTHWYISDAVTLAPCVNISSAGMISIG